MAVLALEPLEEVALVEVPDPDALIERSGGDVLRVGRDGHRRDAILDRQRQDVAALLNVPQPDRAVATTGRNGAAVAGKVERVNVLLVAREGVADLLLVDVPDLRILSVAIPGAIGTACITYPDKLVLGAGRQVSAVGTEADAPDVEVATQLNRVILKDAQLLASLHVEDLGRPVAPSRNVFAIVAEPHAAHYAVVVERVDQIHVQRARDLFVEDADPFIAGLLVVRGDLVKVELAQDAPRLGMMVHAAVVGRGVADLGRLGRARVRDGGVNLGGGGPNRRRGPPYCPPPGAWGCRARRWLWAHAVGHWPLGVALLERRLLGGTRSRRGYGQAARGRGPLPHLAVRAHLLWLRRPWRGRGQSTLPGTSHDPIKQTVPGSDGGRRLLAGPRVLRVGTHPRLRSTASCGFQLATEHLDLFLISKSDAPAC